MHWSEHVDAVAPALPAIWLVRTGADPRNLTERSALRRSTARQVLARQLGCSENDIGIDHDPAGRPLLTSPGIARFHLSLATRAGIVAIGLAQHPLGVDVERVDAAAPLPLDLLHPDERKFLHAIPAAARALAFARLWAAKEAYVKALGSGFLRAPESFAVSLLSETAFRVSDAFAPIDPTGALRTMKNGDHEIMAAAVVIPDRTGLISQPDRPASS